VTCGATSGYNGDLDLRFLWMRSKRLQGSHFASVRECAEVNHLLAEGTLRPCLSRTMTLGEVGPAHQLMFENQQPPGCMALLVGSPRPGLKG
jgi:crotonyl-CoA carboxylase/reductase